MNFKQGKDITRLVIFKNHCDSNMENGGVIYNTIHLV